MALTLVVAEKPSVARDIADVLGARARRDGYLEGGGYVVTWAIGHLVELAEPHEMNPAWKRWSLDGLPMLPEAWPLVPSAGTKEQYAVVRRLLRAREVSEVVCATDAGREGELIFRYILDYAGCASRPFARLWLSSLTDEAIKQAMQKLEPGTRYDDLAAAARSRSEADWIVGLNATRAYTVRYGGGHVLWSIGRVQTPVLALLAQRDDEIRAFDPRPFWELRTVYRGAMFKFAGDRFRERQLGEVLLQQITGRPLAVQRVERRTESLPSPLLYDLTQLQRDMNLRHGLSAQRTLEIAQQLYEGVDIGEGSVGLITYMRTDSVALAAEAVTEIRATIEKLYGRESVAEEVRTFRNKSKNAQEAHEAVRPTSAAITPQLIEGRIDNDQFRLYALIWKRAVACQMAPAVYDTVAVDMLAGPDGEQRHLLRANGSTLVKPGYIAVYQEGQDDAADDDSDTVLPPMSEGDAVSLVGLQGAQHFTEPPPRFSEASLVKALEEHGIGRPSTYASIISTLKDREYVDMDSRRFIPTDIGKIVNDFLSKHFHKYVEYGFTAAMEDELDAVSRGEEDWTEPLKKFWAPFKELVEYTEKNVSRDEVAQSRELGVDPASGRPVSVRMGRFGPFVQIGTRDDEEKPRWAGLRPGQKMDRISFDEAMQLFLLPRKLGTTDKGEEIIANVGRFGPYLKYGAKYASLKIENRFRSPT